MKKLSRDSRNVVIIGTSLFILLTFVFMKHEAVSDSYTSIGFPFTFYQYTEAKTTHTGSWHFQPGYIVINYLLTLSAAILMVEGIKRIRKQKVA